MIISYGTQEPTQKYNTTSKEPLHLNPTNLFHEQLSQECRYTCKRNKSRENIILIVKKNVVSIIFNYLRYIGENECQP